MKKILLTVIVSTSFAFTSMLALAADVVKVGIAAEPYPPLSSKNANGTWEGFEIDLLGKVCAEANLQCEIKDIAWDGIIPALLSKKIDLIFTSMSVTEERAKKVLFTTPYYNSLPVVIGLPDQNWEMNKKALKRKIIGVQTATVSSNYIKLKTGKFAEIREYSTQDEVNSDLLAGRIDFMVADGIPAMAFFADNKGSLQFYGDVEYDAVLGEGIAAAVRHEDTALAAKLNVAIEKLIRGEDYAELSIKHLGTNVAPK
ncbi:transporter substrate-binding domain-containing protein [Marinomonas agarivorans]|nr:transporter substrate-binding domain-containing protein [Marinomonas agarivorans]